MKSLHTAKSDHPLPSAPRRTLAALLAMVLAVLCCACGPARTDAAPEEPPPSGAVSEPPQETAEDPYPSLLEAYREALSARQADPEH